MTTLEQIKKDLAHLDEQQLQQVAEFIESVRSQPEQLACDRKHILTCNFSKSAGGPRAIAWALGRAVYLLQT